MSGSNLGPLVVVHTPEPAAGAGQYVAEFVKALAARQLRVKLYCPANFAYTDEVLASGVQIVSAPFRQIQHASLLERVWRNLTFALKSFLNFWNTFEKGDIVHFQFPLHLFLGFFFLLAARIKGALVVLTVHDPVPHRWLFPPLLRWVETLNLQMGYSICNRLIVHNQAGRQLLLDRFHAKDESIRVIPHGPLHAIEGYNRPLDQSTDDSAPLRLLVFGSIRENKGIHLAIAAVQSLERTCPRRVHLTIAGHVPTLNEAGYWKFCKSLIQSAPQDIQVIEGEWPDSVLNSLFAEHDAILLPYTSFHSESGVAMLALSQQKPILATDAGGLGELLRHADCGFLIETPTVEAVRDAIVEAGKTPRDVLQQQGKRGYEYAVQTRSWNFISSETSKMYQGLLSPTPKIVIHTPEAASSASLYVEALATALADEGVEVAVVCPANLQALQALKAAGISICSCRARALRSDVSLFAKLFQNAQFILSSAATLLRTAKARDIVHLQYILHLPFGLIFLACAKLKRAKLVFTVHDPVPHKFLFPSSLKGVELLGLRLAYQWSDMLIVHSEAGRQKLAETFDISKDKIRVIVHGPYPLRQQVTTCPERNQLEVLCFGSLRENKAPHLAIQAVQKLREEGLEIRLTIAGQVVNRKEEDYWAHCKRLIDPSSPGIRLIEHFIPDEELPQLFSSAHCFVLPYTRFSSDSGVAYMALANRKAIVSTAAGGLGWLLEKSGGGLHIVGGTVDAVAAALRQAVRLGPDRVEAMGWIGGEWVLKNCGWPTVARETCKAYRQFVPEIAGEGASAHTAETSEVEVGVAG